MHRNQSSNLIRILLTLVVLVSTSLACSDSADEAASPTGGAATQPTSVKTKKPAKTSTAASSAKAGTWTVMLYEDGDDSVLEEDAFMDINEAEQVGSTKKVNIVVQIDRYKGAFKGKQSFTGAKRFYLTRDNDLDVINSQEVDDLGEVNMADGQTLVDFVNWAAKTYPADHYVLILADHGAGWPGGWTDPDPKNNPDNALMTGYDDMLYLNELDDALATIQKETGIGKFELIGFDACLMASLEVMAAVAPYANYAVFSQEVEPSMGWAYSAFLKQLTKNPDIDGATLGQTIVGTYIVEDTRIVDDAARARYVEQTYGDYEMSSAEVAKEEVKTVTLSAVDLNSLPTLMAAMDNLSIALTGINQKVVAQARSHTRAFESVFGDEYPSPYIDLGSFVKLIQKKSTSPKVAAAGDAVKAALKDVVVAEKHGSSMKGSSGVSIYFPNSKLFKEDGADYDTYTRIADRFAGESLWDDFLTFHYTGQPLAKNNKPASKTRIIGPGAETVKLDPIVLSAGETQVGQSVSLTTSASGENVAYVYLFTGRFNEALDSLQIVDLDYIDAEQTIEIDGMVVPDWGGSEIPLDLEWQPVEYVLTDGETSLAAMLQPETYGAELADTYYSVDGTYQFASDEADCFARLLFDGEGKLVRVMGFQGSDDSGAQTEIIPTNGDQFTILDQWIPVNDTTDELNYEQKPAGTLTFGDSPWTWESQDAPAGDYVVGVIVEDLDGNTYEEYALVTVLPE